MVAPDQWTGVHVDLEVALLAETERAAGRLSRPEGGVNGTEVRPRIPGCRRRRRRQPVGRPVLPRQFQRFVTPQDARFEVEQGDAVGKELQNAARFQREIRPD